MIARSLLGGACAIAIAALSACGLVTSTSRSVFFVFDVSGTYVKAVPDAAKRYGALRARPGRLRACR